MDGVHLLNHPVANDKLAELRAESTPPARFRALVRDLALLLGVEATRNLPTQEETTTTPMGTCSTRVLSGRTALIPILRAGLGMVDGLLDLLPQAEVRHLGLERDKKTLKPRSYYEKWAGPPANHGLILDPMLATGGSAIVAVDRVLAWGCPDVSFLALIAAAEGVTQFRQAHPDIPLFLAALDDQLDDQSYILPGLGDAGDRQYGTY